MADEDNTQEQTATEGTTQQYTQQPYELANKSYEKQKKSIKRQSRADNAVNIANAAQSLLGGFNSMMGIGQQAFSNILNTKASGLNLISGGLDRIKDTANVGSSAISNANNTFKKIADNKITNEKKLKGLDASNAMSNFDRIKDSTVKDFDKYGPRSMWNAETRTDFVEILDAKVKKFFKDTYDIDDPMNLPAEDPRRSAYINIKKQMVAESRGYQNRDVMNLHRFNAGDGYFKSMADVNIQSRMNTLDRVKKEENRKYFKNMNNRLTTSNIQLTNKVRSALDNFDPNDQNSINAVDQLNRDIDTHNKKIDDLVDKLAKNGIDKKDAEEFNKLKVNQIDIKDHKNYTYNEALLPGLDDTMTAFNMEVADILRNNRDDFSIDDYLDLFMRVDIVNDDGTSSEAYILNPSKLSNLSGKLNTLETLRKTYGTEFANISDPEQLYRKILETQINSKKLRGRIKGDVNYENEFGTAENDVTTVFNSGSDGISDALSATARTRNEARSPYGQGANNANATYAADILGSTGMDDTSRYLTNASVRMNETSLDDYTRRLVSKRDGLIEEKNSTTDANEIARLDADIKRLDGAIEFAQQSREYTRTQKAMTDIFNANVDGIRIYPDETTYRPFEEFIQDQAALGEDEETIIRNLAPLIYSGKLHVKWDAKTAQYVVSTKSAGFKTFEGNERAQYNEARRELAKGWYDNAQTFSTLQRYLNNIQSLNGRLDESLGINVLDAYMYQDGSIIIEYNDKQGDRKIQPIDTTLLGMTISDGALDRYLSNKYEPEVAENISGIVKLIKQDMVNNKHMSLGHLKSLEKYEQDVLNYCELYGLERSHPLYYTSRNIVTKDEKGMAQLMATTLAASHLYGINDILAKGGINVNQPPISDPPPTVQDTINTAIMSVGNVLPEILSKYNKTNDSDEKAKICNTYSAYVNALVDSLFSESDLNALERYLNTNSNALSASEHADLKQIADMALEKIDNKRIMIEKMKIDRYKKSDNLSIFTFERHPFSPERDVKNYTPFAFAENFRSLNGSMTQIIENGGNPEKYAKHIQERRPLFFYDIYVMARASRDQLPKGAQGYDELTSLIDTYEKYGTYHYDKDNMGTVVRYYLDTVDKMIEQMNIDPKSKDDFKKDVKKLTEVNPKTNRSRLDFIIDEFSKM